MQKGNDTLMLRTLMLMVFRRKCGVISVILCLAPLLSFAEPHPPVSLHVQTSDEDSNWKHIDGDESDEVTIFLRERQGTKINEVLARGVVDAPPCHVFQVLRDSDRLVEFMPYLEARITKNASVDFEYVCEYLDLPWPISDRFVSLRIDAVQNYRENRCEYLVSWQKDETYACTVEEARIPAAGPRAKDLGFLLRVHGPGRTHSSLGPEYVLA
jgi:hypothetical protein